MEEAGRNWNFFLENGIPYEIIPGVTSPISVPAYNGIPVTHRDFCSSLHIITGHKRAGQEYDIDFKALTQTKGTLVFLMGIAALEDICKGLLAGGMDRICRQQFFRKEQQQDRSGWLLL